MTLRLVRKSTNRLSTRSVDERRPRSTVTLPRIRARIFLSSRHVSLLLMKVGGGVYLGFSRKRVRSKANPALITALPMNRHYSLRSGSFTILNFVLVAPPFILRMCNLSYFDDVIHIE